MYSKLNRASAIAVAATIMTILVSADASGAATAGAETPPPVSTPSVQFVAAPVVQAVPERREATEEAITTNTATADLPAPRVSAASLARLVAAQPQPAELSRELNCLAGAIYFESKGETLPGQLAVGRVVVNRSKSGRFPNSYCGVVFQRSQFSFVRGNAMPAINKASGHWRNAVAIAQIAHGGTWRSQAEGALFFHAAYVAPGWRLTRLGRIDNHIFYR